MDIEEAAQKTPEALLKEEIDIIYGMQSYNIKKSN